MKARLSALLFLSILTATPLVAKDKNTAWSRNVACSTSRFSCIFPSTHAHVLRPFC
jgi:hypothetical protein